LICFLSVVFSPSEPFTNRFSDVIMGSRLPVWFLLPCHLGFLRRSGCSRLGRFRGQGAKGAAFTAPTEAKRTMRWWFLGCLFIFFSMFRVMISGH